MNVIKFLTKDGWRALYTNVLAKVMYKDNNLSDVSDRQAARDNLELSGDNNHTHYHDDRYLPLIQQAKDEVINLIENLKLQIRDADMVSTVEGDISKFSTYKNGWYKWYGTLNNITATWIIVKADTIYTATNTADPRIVLRSNNLSNWYSPFAYWHA